MSVRIQKSGQSAGERCVLKVRRAEEIGETQISFNFMWRRH